MKKKLICLVVIILLSLNLISVSNKILLEQELARKEYEVDVLKKSCAEHELDSTLIQKADLLYDEYMQYKQRNQETKLHNNIDKAFILYRLALSLHDLERSKEQHERQVESLSLTRKQLEYLKAELDELKLELQE